MGDTSNKQLAESPATTNRVECSLRNCSDTECHPVRSYPSYPLGCVCSYHTGKGRAVDEAGHQVEMTCSRNQSATWQPEPRRQSLPLKGASSPSVSECESPCISLRPGGSSEIIKAVGERPLASQSLAGTHEMSRRSLPHLVWSGTPIACRSEVHHSVGAGQIGRVGTPHSPTRYLVSERVNEAQPFRY